MDISKLSNTELSRLVGQMMRGLNVSWTDYNRAQIVETLRSNAYVFSIISKIARAARNINLLVGRYDGDTFVEDRNNPLAKALYRPNQFMSLSEMKEYAAYYYMSFGETFITYEYFEGGNNRGQIIEGTIQFAPPEITDILHERYIPTGYVINGDVTKELPIEKVIHIKSFNPDYRDLHGLPYLEVAGRLVDKLDAADETEAKTFQNSGPAYLVSPKQIDGFSDKGIFDAFMDSLRAIWRREKKGVAGVNVPMDVLTLGSNPADMGTIESQKNTMKILLTLWGLDAGLFNTDSSTYNNKQMMEQYVYTEAAIPFMEKFVDKLNDRFEKVYGVKVIVDTSDIEVLQPNYRDKVEWMTLAGVFTDNEIREAVNYERVDSEEADMIPNEREGSALVGFDNVDREVIER